MRPAAARCAELDQTACYFDSGHVSHTAPRRTAKTVRSSWAKPPTRFFHGTSSARLDSIRAQGLRPLVHLADSVELAADYAGFTCRHGGGHAVVLEVFGLDPNKLWPDENAMYMLVTA
jgi:hypothetical protein